MSARIITCVLLAASLMPATGYAQSSSDQSVTFELRPHCESAAVVSAFAMQIPAGTQLQQESDCPTYAVHDPTSKQTDVLKEGDPLDMDLIIHNPSGQPIERFRAWIAFDPKVLEGETVEISKFFPTPMPGENAVSASDGYIKVSGTADTAQTSSTVIAAHIRMHVLKTSLASSPVTFFDVSGTTNSHTGIFIKNGTTETNISAATLGSLIIMLSPAAGTDASSAEMQSSASSQSSMPMDATGSTSSSPNGSTVFSLLQVQNLRLTTDGSSVFLAWDKLPSSELVGYNLYYGTISGKYIQKRSLDQNSTNVTIRALPTGTIYYFAIRGVNAGNQETDFSQEQAVTVGDPTTSTAPLTVNKKNVPPPTPKNGGTVSGDTGVPSAFLLFAVLCAVIGTVLAFRRQFTAKPRL